MSQATGGDYYEQAGERLELLQPLQLAPWDQLAPQITVVAESLAANNYAVLDGFIDPAEAHELKKEVMAYYSDGRMVDGEIGRGADCAGGLVNEKMRTDKVLWLEGNEPHIMKFMRRHVLRMDIFTQKLACLLEALHPELSWEGAGRTKIMATCYPGNSSKYVAHFDNPNKNGRIVTTILYLNDGWRPVDGGVLRMKTKGRVVDVAPLFNRLLVFWSDRRCPHEVLPTNARERYAITIWFLDEKERREALRKAQDQRKEPVAAASSPPKSSKLLDVE